MIIIEDQAETKLIQMLRALSLFEGKRCFQFLLHNSTELTRECIISQAQKYLPDSHIYFCQDGEIYLLAPASAKECRKAMLEIADALGIHPAENIAKLYDLSIQSSTLLLLLEKKVASQRQDKEALQRQQAKERAAQLSARRRHEILEQGTRKSAQEIAALRSARGEPVLMIIEDDPFSRRLVDNVLQKQFKLTSLESAEGALATYAELAPDLLFLDINLPDVSGHELLEKIIALDPASYVIMLSGNADKENIVQAMAHGAKGFVAKPFSRDKLFKYIESCPTIAKENA